MSLGEWCPIGGGPHGDWGRPMSLGSVSEASGALNSLKAWPKWRLPERPELLSPCWQVGDPRRPQSQLLINGITGTAGYQSEVSTPRQHKWQRESPLYAVIPVISLILCNHNKHWASWYSSQWPFLIMHQELQHKKSIYVIFCIPMAYVELSKTVPWSGVWRCSVKVEGTRKGHVSTCVKPKTSELGSRAIKLWAATLTHMPVI